MKQIGPSILLACVLAPSTSAQDSGVFARPDIRKTLQIIERKYQTSIEATELRSNQESGIERFATGEELFVSAIVDKQILGELFVLKNTENMAFGLLSLVEVLDFPIEVFVDEGRAEGWFIDENTQFSLDIRQDGTAQAMVNGETLIVPAQKLVKNDDDIYIDTDVITALFGISTKFNFNDLTASLRSEKRLPIQQRLARKNRDFRSGRRNPSPVLPLKEDSGYQFISPQTIDAQLNLGYSNGSVSGLYSILGSRDLAYFNSQFFISGNDTDSLTDSRLTFSKESANGDLLGPLGVTRLDIGDVTGTRIGGGTTSAQSRGFRISNSPIGRLTDIEVTNLAGEIPIDWDVELYRNGILLDQRLEVRSGRYEFNDVPLLFGPNEFELVFYGPQGQVKRETREFLLAGNELDRNETRYNVSLEEVGKSFFGPTSFQAEEDEDLGYRLSGNYTRGLSDKFSVRFGHNNLFGGDETRDTFSLGANATVSQKLLLGADLATSSDGNEALNFNARTLISEQSINLRYQTARTDNEQQDSTQREQLNFTVAGPLINTADSQLGHQTQLLYNSQDENNSRFTLNNDLAVRIGKISFNNNLSYVQVKRDGETTDSLIGGIGFQKIFGTVFARFQARYSLIDDVDLLNLGTQLSWNFTNDIQTRLNVNYDFSNDISRVNWQTNFRDDAFSISTNVNYDSLSEFSFGIFSRFSFGYSESTGGYFFSNQGLTTRGTLIVRVFQDLDLNGRYDEGEPLLEGVDVRASQVYGRATTDENGVAVLASLSVNRGTDIVLDQETFPDPFMIPAIPGISITPREGFVDTFNFPVVMGSEIEGTVYVLDRSGQERNGAYARIDLLDENGDVVKTTEAEYDGFYLFSEIKPGEYTVRVNTNYIENKELRPVDEMEINLGNEGDLLSGRDFLLQKRPFENGYVVNIGTFNSPAILKVYWRMLRNGTLKNLAGMQPFYLYDKATGQYSLNLDFFANRITAQELCDTYLQKAIDCKVKLLRVLRD